MPWRPRAETKDGIAPCWVCTNLLPREFLNEHHRQPQAAGGGDEQANRVFLCPLCHQACHAITKVFVKGKVSQARDMVNLLVKDDAGAGTRMMELVQAEAVAWLSGEKSEFQRVTFNLQRGVYDALKGIAGAIRNPNTKRPLGVGLLMETILTKWVEGYVREQIGSSEKASSSPEEKRGRPEIQRGGC